MMKHATTMDEGFFTNSDNQFTVHRDKERPKPNMRNFRLMGQKSCESVDNVDASEIRLTR